MKLVQIPTSDVNSEYGTVTAWLADDRSRVERDTVLVEVETSKAVLEVTAPDDGVVLFLAREGQELPLAEPVAVVFADEDALRAYEQERQRRAAEPLAAEAPRASVKAVKRAAELGVDLATISGDRLITVKDVEEAALAARPVDQDSLPALLSAPEGVQRILLIGAGLGATQVLDILASSAGQQAVGVVDDDQKRWGSSVAGVPVVGGAARLTELFEVGGFDAAVVAISTSVAVRRKFREACQAAGIPMANVVDDTAKIASDVELGEGNVICAFCHLGTGVRMGDNNFLSAYNSFDHHSVLGSDISTGPGCMSSGVVQVADGVRLGTGIFIEPNLRLGEGVQVSSGAVIVHSVPDHHAVKTKTFTTAVVPLRR